MRRSRRMKTTSTIVSWWTTLWTVTGLPARISLSASRGDILDSIFDAPSRRTHDIMPASLCVKTLRERFLEKFRPTFRHETWVKHVYNANGQCSVSRVNIGGRHADRPTLPAHATSALGDHAMRRVRHRRTIDPRPRARVARAMPYPPVAWAEHPCM